MPSKTDIYSMSLDELKEIAEGLFFAPYMTDSEKELFDAINKRIDELEPAKSNTRV